MWGVYCCLVDEGKVDEGKVNEGKVNEGKVASGATSIGSSVSVSGMEPSSISCLSRFQAALVLASFLVFPSPVPLLPSILRVQVKVLE